MSRTSEIGLSRKQKVYATLETTMGTLKFPNGTTDFIRPVGNAVMNQNPAFANSEELADTLNLLDQFQNATPAGEFTVAMYLRPSSTIATASPPQGSPLFRSLMGSVNAATTASFAANLATAGAVIKLKHIAGGDLPHVGVITAGTEKILYTSLTRASLSATTATLSGLTRAYDGTTAANYATNALITLTSLFYKQETTSPSFSLWIKSDHIVQAMSGCSVNSATLEISNEGGVKLTFNGQGMQMKWAGKDTAAHNAATAGTGVTITSYKRFCTGMYIYDSTKNTAGNLISAINATTNRITLTDALATNWATGDTIEGYVPTETVIGSVVESKDSVAYIDGVSTKIKSGSLNIGAPKQYLTDEIGTSYPEDYLEGERDINSSLNLYFRKSAISYFKDGYSGNNSVVRLTFGDTASEIMEVIMPKCKLQVPTIDFAPPAIELNIPMTALGLYGEDSLEIVFR